MSEALEIIVIEERLGASTYREHTLPFVLESPRGSPGWRLVIAPPDRVLEAFLQSRPRPPEA